MTQMQQQIVEMLDLGAETREITQTVGCTKAYVSMLRTARRGPAKYLTARLRAEIDHLWFNEDLCAQEIANRTRLSIEKVISVVLELERQEARVSGAAKCQA